MVCDAIGRAGETGEVVYNHEECRLHDDVENKNSRTICLGYAYQEFCAAPVSDRKDLLKKWSRAWVSVQRELPEEFEDARLDLFPVVRSRQSMTTGASRRLAVRSSCDTRSTP